MRNLLKVGLAALAITVAGGGAAHAELNLRNDNERSVWFAVYNRLRTEIAHGCLRSRQSVRVDNPAIALEPVLYVRGEIKANADCGGQTVRDTGYGPPVPNTRNNARRLLSPGNNAIWS